MKTKRKQGVVICPAAGMAFCWRAAVAGIQVALDADQDFEWGLIGLL